MTSATSGKLPAVGYPRRCSRLVIACVLVGLAACGGGGGSGGGAAGNGPAGWVAGVFNPASNFDAQCAAPRAGVDPATGVRYPDVQGTALDEKNWLRSWSNDLYLWYSEIVDTDPAPYTTLGYFDVLKSTALTASGKPKDRFHFHLLTSDWQALSQSGVSAGYGAAWAIVAATPPRKVVVAYTEPGSPATEPLINLVRGTEVVGVDGVDAVNGSSQSDVDTLNAAFYPAQANESHTFIVRDPGAALTRTITLTSVNVTSTPVQNVGSIATTSGNVGYILFNDHLATAEQGLLNAVNQLNAAGIVDLVLDVRYNGGGYLTIASEVAFMIAGAARTAGKTFESLRFNTKHPTVNPVTGQRLAPVLFQTTTVGLSAPSGQPLPTLNLPRVFVLTGPETCSASESIINALQGVNVEVIQIGSTTCGKPYGFYPTDNCATTYFSVQFKGENAKGFGDYTDGFSPSNTLNIPGAPVTGCSVADDFTHNLSDPLERRLAAALAYRQTPVCPTPSGITRPPGVSALTLAPPSDARVVKPEWLQNKVMDR